MCSLLAEDGWPTNEFPQTLGTTSCLLPLPLLWKICQLPLYSLPIDVEQQPNTIPRTPRTQSQDATMPVASGPDIIFRLHRPQMSVTANVRRERETEWGGQESHNSSRPLAPLLALGRSLRLMSPSRSQYFILAQMSDDRYYQKQQTRAAGRESE